MEQPVLLPVFGRKPTTYQLARDYRYVTPEGWEISVPAGLITDGASVPRALWWAIPPDGLHRAACLIHDWLYQIGPLAQLFRSDCDKVLRTMLEQTPGLPEWQPRTMWLAVRAFGWLPWSRSTGKPLIEEQHYEIS